MKKDLPLPSLLFVTADEPLVAGLTTDLLRDGFSVAWEQRPERAFERITRERPSFVVLDVVDSRLHAASAIRKAHRGALLVLAPSDAGPLPDVPADDLVARSLPAMAIHGRITSQWSRLTAQTQLQPAASHLNAGPLRLDGARRELTCHGTPVKLTWSEFELAWVLASRADEVVTREEIHQRLSRSTYLTGRIDVHVCRLRRKLAAVGFPDANLRSVRLLGYVLMTK